MKRYSWMLAIAVGTAALGCNSKEKELNAALADAKAASSAKDSLLTEVLAVSGFMNDVNTELGKAKGITEAPAATADRGVPGPERDRAARAATIDNLKKLVVRLNETSDQLDKTQTRLKGSKRANGQLLAQIETYKKTIDELKTAAEQQTAELEAKQAEVLALKSEVDTVRAQNTQLSTDKAALSDTVTQLTTYKNKVYYVVGTKQELLDKGVVVNEGTKFLFFGGKKLLPARDLKPEAFTEADKTQIREIPLPKDDKSYRIVSRQDPHYVATADSTDGKLQGRIEITSPEEFWAPSKYLIVVEN